MRLLLAIRVWSWKPFICRFELNNGLKHGKMISSMRNHWEASNSNKTGSSDAFTLKEIFHILNPCHSQYPPQASRITNLYGLFDIPCWIMIFLTYLGIIKIFNLLEFLAEKMGYCSVVEEEIPFVPFGWVYHLQLTIYLYSISVQSNCSHGWFYRSVYQPETA